MLQWSMLVREVRVEREKDMEGDGEAPGMKKGKVERGQLGRMEVMKMSPQRTAREYWGGGERGRGKERERERGWGEGSQEFVSFFCTFVGAVYMSVVVSC